MLGLGPVVLSWMLLTQVTPYTCDHAHVCKPGEPSYEISLAHVTVEQCATVRDAFQTAMTRVEEALKVEERKIALYQSRLLPGRTGEYVYKETRYHCVPQVTSAETPTGNKE
jgi:hypothetical protein